MELSKINSQVVRDVLKYDFSSREDKYSYIQEYKKILCRVLNSEGKIIVERFKKIVSKLKRKKKSKIVIISATFKGGGVAEMFKTAGFLLKELGVELEWYIIYPDTPQFYEITKSIHNNLQGKEIPLSSQELNYLDKVAKVNSQILKDVFVDTSVSRVYLEDPQVLGMIKYVKEINLAFGL